MPEHTPTYDDLVEMYYALPSADREAAFWIVPEGQVAGLQGLTDTAQQPLWRGALSPEAPDRLLGRPVMVTDCGPVAFVHPRNCAAAPDLLHACNMARRHACAECPQYGPDITTPTECKSCPQNTVAQLLSAAIAKAKGENDA